MEENKKTLHKVIMKRYEYLDRDGEGKLITVGYSIRENEKPYGYKGERLVDTFEAYVKR